MVFVLNYPSTVAYDARKAAMMKRISKTKSSNLILTVNEDRTKKDNATATKPINKASTGAESWLLVDLKQSTFTARRSKEDPRRKILPFAQSFRIDWQVRKIFLRKEALFNPTEFPVNYHFGIR